MIKNGLFPFDTRIIIFQDEREAWFMPTKGWQDIISTFILNLEANKKMQSNRVSVLDPSLYEGLQIHLMPSNLEVLYGLSMHGPHH